MTVLIDPPAWPGPRGLLFSHLAGDASLEELHAFARELGVPPRAFERDHYDVPETLYDRAVRLGATPVSSRELVARLVASGLRRRKRGRFAAERGEFAGHVAPGGGLPAGPARRGAEQRVGGE
ncbi:DUF4031 domain-containing protein [Nocardiopsis composta]|uniref:DUF4031 domain-containing protein n=1 Tax=Nocardiopsis composta TaxID=157465 RepID=A0A7W8VD25_9ACTN|nr:DUF4031 domain-containing protein [Nocardiopsis composta]MBB5432026.1 hypothetical protein [Nocardiopsis composta]